MIETNVKHLAGRMAKLAAGTAAAAILATGVAQAENITVFTWAGYEDPAFYTPYTEAHDEEPNFAFFGDEEEAFQKMVAGFEADVAHPCSQSVPKWRDAGIIEPWDVSRIPAYDDLNPGLTSVDGFVVDGNVYMIPYDWGNTLLVYNTESVPPEDTTSLQIFTDPKYAGRISLPDNVADAYALAVLAIGITDWTTMTDEQFEEANEWLRKAHQNVRFYWQDGGELQQAFANGEIDMAWAWNETPTTAKANGLPVDFTLDTEEGITTWICGLANVANGVGDEDRLYDYVNAMLGEASADFLVGDWGYGHSNMTLMSAMDQELLATYGYDDLESFKDKTLFQAAVDPQRQIAMNEMFERIKAGF
ncbi:MAG: extracellular solute-binding protein [Pseudomonadota bacterium]